jgi:hypothetical protein
MTDMPTLLMLSMQKRFKDLGFEEIPDSEKQYEIQEGSMWQRLSADGEFYVYANFMQTPNHPISLRISAIAPIYNTPNERQKKYLYKEQFIDTTFSILWHELENSELKRKIWPELDEKEYADMLIFLRMNIELYAAPRDEITNVVLDGYFLDIESRMIDIRDNLHKRSGVVMPGQVIRNRSKSKDSKKGIARNKEVVLSK